MHLTSRQFRSLAAEVDDLHHENMKTFAEETAELHLDSYRHRVASSSAARRVVGVAAWRAR